MASLVVTTSILSIVSNIEGSATTLTGTQNRISAASPSLLLLFLLNHVLNAALAKSGALDLRWKKNIILFLPMKRV